MNDILTLTAQTLLEHVAEHPKASVAEACDAALQFLKIHGVSGSGLRDFRTVVQRELRRGRKLLTAELQTPSGKSGEAGTRIHSSLEKTLGVHIDLAENADPALLGGALLSVGDERLDMSLRGALERLTMHLSPSH